MLARSFLFGEMIKSVATSAGQVLHLSNWKTDVLPDENFRKILIISRCLHFSLLLLFYQFIATKPSPSTPRHACSVL